MEKKLKSLRGSERLAAMDLLKRREIDEICKRARSCSDCVFALFYKDRNGISRLTCVDVASRSHVERLILLEGAHFKTEESS